MNDAKTHGNATHLLECRHCIGQSCKTYLLRCHVLKTMADGRLKVLVFGNMWKGSELVQRVRYVENWKVSVKPNDTIVMQTGELTGQALEWATRRIGVDRPEQPKTFACNHNMPTCEYCQWMVMRWLVKELGETVQVPKELVQ